MSLNDWSAADLAAKLSGAGRAKAKPTKRGWMVCCPAHEDRTPSLSIADGREGVLIYHCFAGCSSEAIRDALKSIVGETSVPLQPREKRKVEQVEDPWLVVIPVPQEKAARGLDDFYHFEHGAPSKVWTYRLSGELVAGWVARYELPDGGKEVIPWSWVRNDRLDREELKQKAMGDKRPLYNLDRIEANPDQPVIWNEGEKAADAADKLFPNWIPTANQGGGNAIGLTDLSPLYGRAVILLCDHDGPGYATGAQIADRLLGKCELYQLVWPNHRADGTTYSICEKDDAADHLARGWTVDELKIARENGHRILERLGEIAAPLDLIHYDREQERRFERH